MSYPAQQRFQPLVATSDYKVQFSSFPNQTLQVADYSKVQYLEPSDSEPDDLGDEIMSDYTHQDCE